MIRNVRNRSISSVTETNLAHATRPTQVDREYMPGTSDIRTRLRPRGFAEELSDYQLSDPSRPLSDTPSPDRRPDHIPGPTRSPIPIPEIMPDKGLISQSEIHPGCLQTPLRP